ncbi:lipase secretion chaperone [Undibacterium arcticum]|uniref:Lipase helper protein n=1 Tax=Undibacterium arcticum TaxID=1762892 RepID=A0ABV7F8E3_9BURK
MLAVVFFIVARHHYDREAAPQRAADANLFPFVRSMDGTRPDGDLRLAAGDALVVDARLRRMFDYYLSAVGEKPLAAIRKEIEQELERRLKPAAATGAKRLLARYLDYKRALVALEQRPHIAGASITAARARLLAMREMRAQYFNTTETQGMFGFDDAYDMDAVTRLEISQDPSLTAAQKKAKLAGLDAAMAPALRAEREAPLAIVKLEEAVNQMRAQGASQDDIYRMRAAALTPEAAARLADVDQEEAAWKSRIASYLAERKAVSAGSAKLSEADQQLALQQLRQARFSADEQKRLAAYE